jgi:hypothetical protein
MTHLAGKTALATLRATWDAPAHSRSLAPVPRFLLVPSISHSEIL